MKRSSNGTPAFAEADDKTRPPVFADEYLLLRLVLTADPALTEAVPLLTVL